MPKLLTIEEVAKALNKSVKTVYNYLETGIMDCGFKLGNEWRIDENDLCEWIERKKKSHGLVKAA